MYDGYISCCRDIYGIDTRIALALCNINTTVSTTTTTIFRQIFKYKSVSTESKLKAAYQKSTSRSSMLAIHFTARCYAERGIVMASRLSVRPSVCDVEVYRGHIGWNTSKIISRLISLRCSLSTDPNSQICSKGNNPKLSI